VRGRGEAHSFNLIEFQNPTLKVHRLECKPGAPDFLIAETREYAQTPSGWTPNLADSA
jgi:hypothetical protein